MGQVVTKDNLIETVNYDDIHIKFKSLIKQLNESCKEIGLLRVYYHGDIMNTDALTYIYITCMYLDNNSHLDSEIMENCISNFTLLVPNQEGSMILNPRIQKYIQNSLHLCQTMCTAIPGCTSISYSISTVSSSTTVKPHPIGYTIIVYPIIS
jgi:hypothetical protein